MLDMVTLQKRVVGYLLDAAFALGSFMLGSTVGTIALVRFPPSYLIRLSPEATPRLPSFPYILVAGDPYWALAGLVFVILAFAVTRVEFRNNGICHANWFWRWRLTPWEDMTKVVSKEKEGEVIALCVYPCNGGHSEYDACHFRRLEEAKRMAVEYSPGHGGEMGRVRGQKGSMLGLKFEGTAELPKLDLAKPPLPPHVEAGGHGGSHGYLGNEFVTSILQSRRPLVDIAWALNMTVAGIVAHQSAMKDGELMKIPQYNFA